MMDVDNGQDENESGANDEGGTNARTYLFLIMINVL